MGIRGHVVKATLTPPLNLKKLRRQKHTKINQFYFTNNSLKKKAAKEAEQHVQAMSIPSTGISTRKAVESNVNSYTALFTTPQGMTTMQCMY